MMTNDLIIIYFCVFSGLKCVSLEDVGIDLNDELAKIANRAETGEEGPDGKDLKVPNMLIPSARLLHLYCGITILWQRRT